MRHRGGIIEVAYLAVMILQLTITANLHQVVGAFGELAISRALLLFAWTGGGGGVGYGLQYGFLNTHPAEIENPL